MMNLPPINRREFLRLTALATGSLSAISLPAAAPVPAVPGRRLERLTSGANVCGWFRFPRNESAELLSGYIPEAEAAFMASLGIKHVRLCVAPRIIMNPANGDVREDRAKCLEAAMERIHHAGLLVMVDIHIHLQVVSFAPDDPTCSANRTMKACLKPSWREIRAFRRTVSRLAVFRAGRVRVAGLAVELSAIADMSA